jgi:hypothetical protein
MAEACPDACIVALELVESPVLVGEPLRHGPGGAQPAAATRCTASSNHHAEYADARAHLSGKTLSFGFHSRD